MVDQFNTIWDKRAFSFPNQVQHDDERRLLFETRIFPVLNMCWSFIMYRGKASIYIKQALDHHSPYPFDETKIITESEFKLAHRELRVTISFRAFKHIAKDYALLPIWIGHPSRSIIKLAYNPPCDYAALLYQAELNSVDIARGIKVHNTFKGFRITESIALTTSKLASELEKEKDPLYWHLKFVLCSGKQELTDYFIGWLAYIIQKKMKTEICIALVGGHGAGKSLFVNRLKEIFGYFYPMQIAGDINVCGEDFEQALIVFCDEVKKFDINLYNRYKAAISENKQQSRDPHQAARTFFSFSNFIFASNTDLSEIIPMDASERRFVILKVSDVLTKKRDDSDDQRIAYFNRLKECDIRPFARILYEATPITRGQSIETEANFDTKVHSLPSFTAWWYNCLKKGRISLNKVEKEDIFSWLDSNFLRNQSLAVKTKVYACYLEYSGSPKLSDAQFWIAMRTYKAGAIGRLSSQERVIRFNDLNECRRSFIAVHGNNLPWFDSEEDKAIEAAAAERKQHAIDVPSMSPQVSVVCGNSVDEVETLEDMMRGTSISDGASSLDQGIQAAVDRKSNQSNMSEEEKSIVDGLSDDDDQKFYDEDLAEDQLLTPPPKSSEVSSSKVDPVTGLIDAPSLFSEKFSMGKAISAPEFKSATISPPYGASAASAQPKHQYPKKKYKGGLPDDDEDL